MVLGVHLDARDRDKPLGVVQAQALRARSGSQQETLAHTLASQGRTPLEILGHGVLDPNPGVVGTAEQVADMF